MEWTRSGSLESLVATVPMRQLSTDSTLTGFGQCGVTGFFTGSHDRVGCVDGPERPLGEIGAAVEA